MNALLNNPYNEVMNPGLDFSESYFDAIVDSVKNKDLFCLLLESCLNDASDKNVDDLWNMLPINPEFKLCCNEVQAKNVLRYLIKKA